MRSAALWTIPTVVALAAAASASPPGSDHWLRQRSNSSAVGLRGRVWLASNSKIAPSKFSVDVDNGVGFYDGGDGIIGLPAKDLSEEAVSKAARSPAGAAACRISMSQRFQLVVDGKPISRNRVHHLRFVSVDGLEHWTAIFSCTMKEKSGGERELWVYGKDKEPIYKAPLKESDPVQRPFRAVGSSDAVALAAASVGNEKLVLDVTLLGKYTAELELWCGELISPEDFLPRQLTRNRPLPLRHRGSRLPFMPPRRPTSVQFSSAANGQDIWRTEANCRRVPKSCGRFLRAPTDPLLASEIRSSIKA